MPFCASIAIFLLISTFASAASNPFRKRAPAIQRRHATYDASAEYWFDQLIDHSNPSAGTFKQRYFFSDEFYGGTGAPVVLNSPGEQSADGFDTDLTGASLQFSLLQQYGAAGVVLEHRYWGKSSPYPSLTADTMKYLTVDQAVEDYVYFVKSVQLPFKTIAINTHPDTTPWVNIGCSYPGLLVAYTQEKHSDVFAAGWATSAPVQADGDFWEYWEPVEEGMPKNCSSDLGTAMSYIDNILSTGTPDQVTALKTRFGLEALANDDFGNLLIYPLNTWQDLQAYDFAWSGESLFHQFCDVIETNADGTVNTAETGIGLPQALTNWAAIFKYLGPDTDCPGMGGGCYNSYNYTDPFYTNTSVSDTYDRGWLWLMCTQMGWFQNGDLGNSSKIISSHVTLASSTRMCNHMFPNADGTPGNYNPSAVSNTAFSGWNLIAKNLFVVNGQYDPWRSASLSSKYAPAFIDTPTQDINVIPNAHHCWDFYSTNAEVDANVLATQNEGRTKIYGWLNDWYTAHPSVPKTLKALPTGGDVAAVIEDDGTDDDVTADDTVDNTVADTADNTLDDTADDTVDDTTEDDAAEGDRISSEEDATINAGVDKPIGTLDDATQSGSDNNNLQSQIDKLQSSKKLALVSYIINAVLVILLIVAIVLVVRARGSRSRAHEGAGLLPKWGGAVKGDALGEYGSGAPAGGRGQYQVVKEEN